MKKLLSLLLALAVALSLCACTDHGSGDTLCSGLIPDSTAADSTGLPDNSPAPDNSPVPDSTGSNSSAVKVPFTVTPVTDSPSLDMVTLFLLHYEGELREFSGHHMADSEYGGMKTYYFDLTGDGQEELVVFLVPGEKSGPVMHEIHIFDGVTLEEYDTSDIWTTALSSYSFTGDEGVYYVHFNDETVGSFTQTDVLAQWFDNPGYSSFEFLDPADFLSAGYHFATVEDGQLCINSTCFVGTYWQSYGRVQTKLSIVDGVLTVAQAGFVPPVQEDDSRSMTLRLANGADGLAVLAGSAVLDTLLYGDATQTFSSFGRDLTDLRLADLDGDGTEEVAITAWTPSESAAIFSLYVLEQEEDLETGDIFHSYTFQAEDAEDLGISARSARLTPGEGCVTVEWGGLTCSLPVDAAAEASEGGYYLSSESTNRIIRWVDGQPYLYLTGRLCKGVFQTTETGGSCGVSCELVCRLDYTPASAGFSLTPVSLEPLSGACTPFYHLIEGEMCDIFGYDADALSYTNLLYSSDTWSLYFASPRFLSSFFEGIVTEGSATLKGNRITVSFTRHDDSESGAVTGAGIEFTVNLANGTVTSATTSAPGGDTGTPIDLEKSEMVEIAEGLAQVIRDVKAYLAENK